MNPSDRAEIVDVVASLGVLVDARDWKELVGLFTPVVRVDYTSLFGGTAEEKPATEVVDRWAAFLPRFTGTQHLIGVPRVHVDGDLATVEAPVIAHHFTGDALREGSSRWVVGGHYRLGLRRQGERWSISSLTLAALWQEGSPPD